MLVLALHDLTAPAARLADVDRRDVGRGAARHRPRLRRRPASRCARSPGQAVSAANLRRLLAGSEIVASHRYGRPARAGRLLAALHAAGPRRGARHPRPRRARRRGRARSAIDNPMVLPDGRVESCGNFHGAPAGARLRLPRDRGRPTSARSPSAAPTACSTPTPLARAAAVPRRRRRRQLRLMIAQYTQAAMVAENRRLAVPAERDSLPTSAMQEDHVSMGWGAARKLRRVGRQPARILAVELACAARGARPARAAAPAPAPAAALAALRDGRRRPRPRPLAGARARSRRSSCSPRRQRARRGRAARPIPGSVE